MLRLAVLGLIASSTFGCSLVVDADSFGVGGDASVPFDMASADTAPPDHGAGDGTADMEPDAGDPCDPGTVEVVNGRRLASGLFEVELAADVEDGTAVAFAEPGRFFAHGDASFGERRATLVYDAFRLVTEAERETAILRVGTDECGADIAVEGLPVAPAIARVSDPEDEVADSGAEAADVANDGTVVFASRAGNLPQDDEGARAIADAYLRAVAGEAEHLSPDASRDCVNIRINEEGTRVAFSVRGSAAEDIASQLRIVDRRGTQLDRQSHGCSSCFSGAPLASDLRGDDRSDLVWLEADEGADTRARRLFRDRGTGQELWLEVPGGFLDQPRLQPNGSISVLYGTPAQGLLLLERPAAGMELPELVDPDGITLALAEATVGADGVTGIVRLVGLPSGTRVDLRREAGPFERVAMLDQASIRDAADDLSVWAGIGTTADDGDAPLAVFTRTGSIDDPRYVRFGSLPRAQLPDFRRAQLRSLAVSPDGRWLAYVDFDAEPPSVFRVQLRE